ncbi:MAG: hypothetical protein ACTSRK_19795 [Promethearchaeota archaeon]
MEDGGSPIPGCNILGDNKQNENIFNQSQQSTIDVENIAPFRKQLRGGTYLAISVYLSLGGLSSY